MTDRARLIPFRENSAKALRDESLRYAMNKSTDTFTEKRAAGITDIPMEEWRDIASDIRIKALDHLPDYLDRFAQSAVKVGAVIHRAKDAEAAREITGYLLKDRGVKKVVKAKSMVTEEIELNPYLETLGITPVETDLGEYIVQIAGEHPSHILAPAIHKDRKAIGRLFAEKLGVEYSEDPEVLTKIARNKLRTEFLTADAGMSGVNMAAADTGTLTMFTNEGNGRMVTTLPPIHVAVMSIEKVIPSLADLPAFIRLLPRSATGQILSSYVSMITGTRKPGDTTGAKELHIVMVDNGRSEILRGEFREILKCIRCSACMNVCPVYKAIGGHAYGSTYPGPMGIILTNLLEGLEHAHPLLDASTLCGACAEVCPVRVPLPELIDKLRRLRVEHGLTPIAERAAMAGFSIAVRSGSLFSAGQGSARYFWSRLMKSAGMGDRLPKPAEESFKRRMT